VPWKVVLGNHDYEGVPEAQVEFMTSAENAATGNLWHCPSVNYSFDVRVGRRAGAVAGRGGSSGGSSGDGSVGVAGSGCGSDGGSVGHEASASGSAGSALCGGVGGDAEVAASASAAAGSGAGTGVAGVDGGAAAGGDDSFVVSFFGMDTNACQEYVIVALVLSAVRTCDACWSLSQLHALRATLPCGPTAHFYRGAGGQASLQHCSAQDCVWAPSVLHQGPSAC
jgi:hypothetical protein